MRYRVISTDDHLQEAPDTWTSRMSAAKWGDKIPQLKPLDHEREAWFVYGEPNKRLGVAVVHGALPDRAKSLQRWEDVPRIAYVPEERIKAMDQDGVDAHTLFGNIAGVAGGTARRLIVLAAAAAAIDALSAGACAAFGYLFNPFVPLIAFAVAFAIAGALRRFAPPRPRVG